MEEEAQAPVASQLAPPLAGTIPGTATPLYGVHGWLKFWVVVLIYLGPIFTVLKFIFLWIGFVYLADQHGGGIIIFGVIDTTVDVALTLRGIQVGIGLRDMRPRAVQSTKLWLWLVLGWAFFSPIPALLLGFPKELIGPEAIRSDFFAVISFAIWYSYFNDSKRVKATYSDWAEE